MCLQITCILLFQFSPPVFTEVADQVGLIAPHGFVGGIVTEQQAISGGLATGDVDNDGWVDVFVVGGDAFPHHLYRNVQGLFVDVTSGSGLEMDGLAVAGPAFGDLNGDGLLDFLCGGIQGQHPRVFLNTGNLQFLEVTISSQIQAIGDTFSCAMGDFNRDGHLDVFLSHWGSPFGDGRLWRNNGQAVFTDVDDLAGTAAPGPVDYSFSPTFTDFNGDGWPDILLASDFGHSQVFMNRGDGTFLDITSAVITDENGMGSAVADFDNDGDMDWFVSSIWDPDGLPNGNWGITGNRMYENSGNGAFADITDHAGTRQGYWGWGSAAQDYNNDGWIDLFHVNGFFGELAGEFHHDPSRLFVNQSGFTFLETSEISGIADTGQGRGVACFDYDRDGDIDILIQQNSTPVRLYRNDTNTGNYLTIQLQDTQGKRAAGARIVASTPDGMQQTREIRVGSHFVSQDPDEAFFGLGPNQRVQLDVIWPDGAIWHLPFYPANQVVVIRRDQPALPVPTLSGYGPLFLALLALVVGLHQLRRGQGS
ncbi:MAG: CRTAC1 family protein [Acidobacteria bacterium]|nr:CRTAC1 family protein [Acidobacteriota bacterium]